MSLLMQALKKAERAKQNSLPEEELDKPSQEFDELLDLTPQPAPAPAGKTEFSLEPMEGLSLEPLAPPVAAATTTPRPAPDPLPSFSDHKQPGLTLDLALDPIAAPPLQPSTPSPTPFAATVPASAAAAGVAAGIGAASDAGAAGGGRAAGAAGAAAGAAAALSAAAAGGARAAGATGAGVTAASTQIPAPPIAASATAPSRAPLDPPPATSRRADAAASAASASAASASAAGASAASSTRTRASASDKPAESPRAAARARARAAATVTEPPGMDPERLRLIGLIALLVLLVGGFGLYYWRALSGPGAGASLPPVPMPPAGATGATPAGKIVSATPGAAPADDLGDNDPMLAPAPTVNRAAEQDLERRLARTEQELAMAQQAIQAAVTPKPEQLPVVAPPNNDIRVTRQVQPSPVAPALDNAYQAFNNGDTAGAQQQYDAALAQDPNNRDALIGAATVAARQNQKDKAAAYYLHLLELSPNDADATAGLISLRQGDISRSEARLKNILANNPEAGPVLFTLGNLYAQQGRWQDAQQAYFRAVGAAPDNPDYAYNLAIGLDRLNQSKLAITYYQRALALGQDKTVGFDRNTLRKRLHELTVANH